MIAISILVYYNQTKYSRNIKAKIGENMGVRKLLESKLNGGNIIKAINTWAISMLRYSTSFLAWMTISDLQESERRASKLMTMHNSAASSE